MPRGRGRDLRCRGKRKDRCEGHSHRLAYRARGGARPRSRWQQHVVHTLWGAVRKGGVLLADTDEARSLLPPLRCQDLAGPVSYNPGTSTLP